MRCAALRDRARWPFATAIGADAGRIIQQVLTEHAVLALLGGIGGVGLGALAAAWMLVLLPQGIPHWVSFSMDARFALFSVAITGAAAMLSVWRRRCRRRESTRALYAGSGSTLLPFSGAPPLDGRISRERDRASDDLLVGAGLLLQPFTK